MSSTSNATSSAKPQYAKLRYQLKGMGSNISGIAVSPDSLNVAALTNKGEVRAWDLSGSDPSGFVFKPPKKLAELSRDPRGIAFSGNGRFLAAAVVKAVHVWVAKTGQPKFEFVHQDDVNSVAFSPDSKHLACGSVKDIHIWDLDTKQQLRVLKGHTKLIRGLCYSSGGTQLVSASEDSSLRIWNLEQGEKLQDTWKVSESKYATGCALSPDDQKIATADKDNQVILWDTASGDWLARPFRGHSNWVTSVAFSPDGKHLASASSGDHSKVLIQDAASDTFIAELEGHLRVAYTPDGKHIITVDKNNKTMVSVLILTNPAASLHVAKTQGSSQSMSSSTAGGVDGGSSLNATGHTDNWPPPYE